MIHGKESKQKKRGDSDDQPVFLTHPQMITDVRGMGGGREAAEYRHACMYARTHAHTHTLTQQDYRAARNADLSDHGEDDGGDGESTSVTTCGDWIWDGEFWNNADGVSFHPG